MISILHSLPGRTRIFLPSTNDERVLEARLRNIPGVYSASYSPLSQTALLYHRDPKLAADWESYLPIEQASAVKGNAETEKPSI